MTTAISGSLPRRGSITVTCVSTMGGGGGAARDGTVLSFVVQADRKTRAASRGGMRMDERSSFSMSTASRRECSLFFEPRVQYGGPRPADRRGTSPTASPRPERQRAFSLSPRVSAAATDGSQPPAAPQKRGDTHG